MKKIVGTIAAIALAASSAFAGVNVGMGFNRGVFAPFLMQKIGDNTDFYMTKLCKLGMGRTSYWCIFLCFFRTNWCCS